MRVCHILMVLGMHEGGAHGMCSSCGRDFGCNANFAWRAFQAARMQALRAECMRDGQRLAPPPERGEVQRGEQSLAPFLFIAVDQKSRSNGSLKR